MPVQQAVDVAVPVETAYNQWTQFEDWPEFMHRVTRVTQEDDCTVSFATKIWGKTKEFEAEIETQRPDERIKWSVSQGITHTGVVTFHELAPRLTRIELNLDVDPGSLIEKAARGMRHIKRAVRADLHRFKAFIEMQELETGAWRGVIEDGEVVEEHDASYDEEREYSDVEDLKDEDSRGRGRAGRGAGRGRGRRGRAGGARSAAARRAPRPPTPASASRQRRARRRLARCDRSGREPRPRRRLVRLERRRRAASGRGGPQVGEVRVVLVEAQLEGASRSSSKSLVQATSSEPGGSSGSGEAARSSKSSSGGSRKSSSRS